MRKYLLSAAVLSSLVLAAGGNSASAASLSITEVPGGNVTATPDLCGWSCNDWQGLNSLTSTAETLNLSANIFNPSLNAGIETYLISDPDGSASDVLNLTWAPGGGAGSSTDVLTAHFCSTPDLGACGTIGTVHHVSEDANGNVSFGSSFDPNISIQVASPEEVPEPASLALLGVGLAGLGMFRRRRRTQS